MGASTASESLASSGTCTCSSTDHSGRMLMEGEYCTMFCTARALVSMASACRRRTCLRPACTRAWVRASLEMPRAVRSSHRRKACCRNGVGAGRTRCSRQKLFGRRWCGGARWCRCSGLLPPGFSVR